jgi:enamidase
MPFRARTDRSPLRTLSPRQNQIGWIDSLLRGRVTTMISADKVHVPGRPRDVVGLKVMAFFVQRAFWTLRPGGVKGPRWRPIIETEIVEQTFKELATAGVKLLGEVGLAASRMARPRATQFAE